MYVNFNNECGKVKPMHAVNNAPVYKWQADQRITNMEDYKAAGIPYARNHDASFLNTYGGNHTVDVNFIFTDFDADPYDEASYDFACTDELVRVTELSGAKTFYRLGSKIEHEIKKYNTLPPKDFKKWAVICEHIIKHYTEGWANGFHYDMEYWEIWNEADGTLDDSENKCTWGGTKKEFFEFYHIAATHLKECFPNLKIGGPSLAFRVDWAEDFLKQLKAPLDFFSWHCYDHDVKEIMNKVAMYREMLDKYGFESTESILNEWNYVKGWEGDNFLYSVKTIMGLKGSAFTLAAMLACQNLPIDMLMYYDARPCAFNGLWAPYTYEKLKCYYSFVAFNELYKLGTSVEVKSDTDNVYIAAAKNDTSAVAVICYYNDDDNAESVEVKLCAEGIDGYSNAEYYLLDEDHDLEKVEPMGDTIRLSRNSTVMIKYI